MKMSLSNFNIAGGSNPGYELMMWSKIFYVNP